MTIELDIEGMSCGHCTRAVKEALEGVAGVRSATVTLEPGLAKVDAENVDALDLIAAVEAEGYRARIA